MLFNFLYWLLSPFKSFFFFSTRNSNKNYMLPNGNRHKFKKIKWVSKGPKYYSSVNQNYQLKCDGNFFVMFYYVANGKWNAALCESEISYVLLSDESINAPFCWFSFHNNFFTMECDVGIWIAVFMYIYYIFS